jgi:hypothetical protein
MYDNTDFFPRVVPGSSSTTFEPSSSVISLGSGMDGRIDDDFPSLFFQHFNSPLTLANTHLPPSQDSEYYYDDESGFDEVDEEEDDFIDIDWDSAILETIADMSDVPLSPVSGEYDASLAETQAYNSRSHRGRRWEPYYPRQGRPLLHQETERSGENIFQNDSNCGDSLREYAMIDTEDEDEDELSTDSCFNLIEDLDCLMLPTAQVLEIFCREPEVEDTDTDLEDDSDWSIFEWE